jgi:hypothetical protein
MRSPWSTRLLRAFLALWFALSGTEMGATHACPMHDGAAASSMHAAPEHAGHGGHASGASSSASEAATGHDGTDATHHCTCVGMGCGSASVASLASGPVVQSPEAQPRAVAGHVDREDVRIARAVHVLPFANGPPARVLTA